MPVTRVGPQPLGILLLAKDMFLFQKALNFKRDQI